MLINDLKKVLSLPSSLSQNENWHGAVCCILLNNNIVFIKRSEEMPTHRGQLAFPGGHRKEGETIFQTGLREFHEEMGDAFNPYFLGILPLVQTAQTQKIWPVLLSLDISLEDFFKNVRSNGEWSELFVVPIKDLADCEGWGYAQRVRKKNDSKPIFFFPLKAYTYQSLNSKNDRAHTLWGMTAQIVLDLLKILYAKDEEK